MSITRYGLYMTIILLWFVYFQHMECC